MSLSPIPRLARQRARPAPISDLVVNNFSGGLRMTGNEEALQPKYAVLLENMSTEEDNSQVLRFGTKEFSELSDNIVSVTYFKNHHICFLTDGTISKVSDAGTITIIWNETIANALPGAPSGWSTTTHVDFTIFKGELIVFNNVDKPLLIDASLAVNYLQDKATGSNVFTPIAKFVTVCDNYTVAAGISGIDDIYISSSGTSGVWPGDAAPNNSIAVSLGTLAGTSDNEFRGISSFKNLLVVFMSEIIVVLELGIFDADGVHTPRVFDIIEDATLINHKCIIRTKKNLFAATTSGIYNLVRNFFGNNFDTSTISSILGQDYQKTISEIDLQDNQSFFVRDRLKQKIFLVLDQGTSKTIFCAFHDDDYRNFSWSTITNWNFKGGTTTTAKRLFLFEDTKLYQYGNDVFDGEAYYTDKATDIAEGEPIPFTFELPWIDANARIKTKQLVNLVLDSFGSAQFFVHIFVDRFYKNTADEFTPALTMKFTGGDTQGFGVDVGGFGGGRRTSDERMFNMPVRFRIVKFQITGETNQPLRFTSIGMIYQRGNYNI